jgi:hypothetical protein
MSALEGQSGHAAEIVGGPSLTLSRPVPAVQARRVDSPNTDTRSQSTIRPLESGTHRFVRL